MKNISRLSVGFGIIIFALLISNIGHTNPDSIGTLTVPDNISQSRAAFAVVEEEIARHLKLDALSEQDHQKLRGPVLLKIRTAIHFQLRQEFGRIISTVDFRTQTGVGSQRQSPSVNQGSQPILHKRAAEIIHNFISQGHISVIIRSDGPIGFGEVATIRGLRGEVRYTYERINGACVSVPLENLTALIKRPFITEIWPDSKGNSKLADSVPQIGADTVHNTRPVGLGITGEGVYVAVVDSGIDSTHSEFQGRIIDNRRVSINDDHGTHVAGIIGASAGVAPKVKFLDARISGFTLLQADDFFASNPNYSDTLDAIEWASQRKWLFKADEKADVINMSWGWPIWIYGQDGDDPMSELIDEVVDDGVVFVVSAGNEALKRTMGTIHPNSKPLSHTFYVNHSDSTGKVIPSITFTLTLLWDKEVNDLDLVFFDSSGQPIAASRNSPFFFVGKTYQDKTKHGTSKFYEQVELESQSQSGGVATYTLQVEAPAVQDAQEYEVWLGSKHTFFDPTDPVSPPNPAQTVGVPGYSRKAITVGAVNKNSQGSIFSSRGPSNTNLIKPEIVAPGESIKSTIRGSGYKEMQGTSMAAPHVAGVAALILDAVGKNDSDEWNFSPNEVKAAIVRGAERVGNISNTPDNIYGAGLVRADNIIFSNTVPANGRLRFEIKPRLYDFNYGGYSLNADPYIKAAISWENPAHNLDLALSDAANGKTLPILSQVASNSTKIGGNEFFLPNRGATYFLDVINKSQKPVTFTGASTHPIKSQDRINISHSTLTTHTHSILSVAFSPNRGNNTLAYGSADGTVHLWDVSTKSLKHTLRGHTDHVLSVAFSPDGRILASGSADNTVRLWDARTGNLRDTLHRHTNLVFSVVFSPDGRTLASGSLDGTIRLWDPGTGRHKSVLTGNLAPVLSVAFSPDGHTLASGGTDSIVRLLNPSGGELLHTLRDHTDFVLSTAFRADGQILASGSADGTVRLWNLSTGNLQHTLTAHTDWVNSVDFSPNPDGFLASGSGDGTVRLWDTYTGDQHTLTAHKNSVESVAFNTDGSALVSGDADGKILLWEFTLSTSKQSVSSTVDPQVTADVDGNGVVDIIDLVHVASLFGTKGQSDADINGDGVVDIVDLVLVANAFGNTANAPAMRSLAIEHLTIEQVSQWLQEAEVLDKTSLTYRGGILVLESLLAMLTPQKTLLLLNYPNPFNPETWIPYQLSEPVDVTVTIHSINGSLIRTLALGHQSAGIYQSKSRAAYWDGRNQLGEPVASGLYFYTLTAGDFTATRKMLIRK